MADSKSSTPLDNWRARGELPEGFELVDHDVRVSEHSCTETKLWRRTSAQKDRSSTWFAFFIGMGVGVWVVWFLLKLTHQLK